VTLHRAQFRAALVGLPLVLALPLAGCAGKPADSAAAASGSTSSSASSTSGAATSGAEQRIEVTFAHGKASGDTGRVQVTKGTSVALVVTSDVADEVHLHGYDIEKELSPGTPVTLQFDATITGVFEVELHKANTVLLRLQVS
jgi:pullulanase/glycogen debranching enzyme